MVRTHLVALSSSGRESCRGGRSGLPSARLGLRFSMASLASSGLPSLPAAPAWCRCSARRWLERSSASAWTYMGGRGCGLFTSLAVRKPNMSVVGTSSEMPTGGLGTPLSSSSPSPASSLAPTPLPAMVSGMVSSSVAARRVDSDARRGCGGSDSSCSSGSASPPLFAGRGADPGCAGGFWSLSTRDLRFESEGGRSLEAEAPRARLRLLLRRMLGERDKSTSDRFASPSAAPLTGVPKLGGSELARAGVPGGPRLTLPPAPSSEAAR
mmetsp:Transcript_21146/g.64411  ORF Transcript_21146/g.64411 Transcript_21146/m.64411 type:complete len:268 (+) Transcript_21146:480-1283(+)